MANEVMLEMQYSPEDCFDAARDAIENLKKFKLKSADRAIGILQASVSPGLTSTTWGDTLTVTIGKFDGKSTKVTVNSSSKSFSIMAGGQQARNIQAFTEAFSEELQNYEMMQEASVSVNQADAADEIMKFKKLLDAGAITEEEFSAKKKQLLGL